LQGFTCTVELKNGELYRGLVVDVEDTWNVQMQTAVLTDRDGKTSTLEHVYLRGSQVRFVIVPDMLKNAPMFAKLTQPADEAKTTAKAAAAGLGARGGAAAASDVSHTAKKARIA